MESYNIDNEIGIDEAGRGCLMGRVYAGCVIWDNNKKNSDIKDSKKLSRKKRNKAFEWIKTNLKWGVGFADELEVDKINILNATKLAMKRSLENLKNKYNINLNDYIILIDGVGFDNLITKNTISIKDGDNKYYSIAGGSIIAKESHDDYIKDLCKNNIYLVEKYNLNNNMGYGTKKHMEGIEKYGISCFHRKTFKPCYRVEFID